MFKRSEGFGLGVLNNGGFLGVGGLGGWVI